MNEMDAENQVNLQIEEAMSELKDLQNSQFSLKL